MRSRPRLVACLLPDPTLACRVARSVAQDRPRARGDRSRLYSGDPRFDVDPFPDIFRQCHDLGAAAVGATFGSDPFPTILEKALLIIYRGIKDQWESEGVRQSAPPSRPPFPSGLHGGGGWAAPRPPGGRAARLWAGAAGEGPRGGGEGNKSREGGGRGRRPESLSYSGAECLILIQPARPPPSLPPPHPPSPPSSTHAPAPASAL